MSFHNLAGPTVESSAECCISYPDDNDYGDECPDGYANCQGGCINIWCFCDDSVKDCHVISEHWIEKGLPIIIYTYLLPQLHRKSISALILSPTEH